MDGLNPGATPALPPEAPLAMPVQRLDVAPPNPGRPASSPAHMAGRRLFVIGGAVLLTGWAAREMTLVLGVNGLTPLAYVLLALYISLFAWIALALFSAIGGFIALVGPPAPATVLSSLTGRTALLMPAYNENPARITAALEAMHDELAALGQRDRFDLFMLSDTTDPAVWVTEEHAYLKLRARIGAVYYRRRPRNTERKAGNIADWVRRWGAAYDHFIILDADSVMTGDCIVGLVAAMERTPSAGLIQTLPVITGGRTLFARMQQFAGRLYGPLIAHGIAWWHGAEGNYWGHNAVIRTRAFAEAAGLPVLTGRKPFGGHVLSHDFVEAALLRRAGWGVHMLPGLSGSYEEGPPSLTDVAVRDRRWCQGNLQHAAILPTRGLHPISRLHLLMGIGAYVTAPLWLLFLVFGILTSLQSRFLVPDYFPSGPSLFPRWPVVDPVRSMWVFIFTMAVLLGPKLLATLAALLRSSERRAFGGGVRLLAGLLIETVLTGLIAPVAMLTQSGAVCSILAGRDGGWQPQRREDGHVPFTEVAKGYWRHMAVGGALAAAAWLVSTALFLWMAPVALGLALAIPLAGWTGRRAPGAALRRLGLLTTPEERTPPPALAKLGTLQAHYADEPGDPVTTLLAHPRLLAAHMQMLPPPRGPGEPFDPALLVGRAKLAEADSVEHASAALTRAEKLAVLGDAEALAGLVELQRRSSLIAAE